MLAAVLRAVGVAGMLLAPLGAMGQPHWPPSASPFVDPSLHADQLRHPPMASELGSLVHVQLLHRHGDRAPVHVAPAQAALWAKQGLRAGQLSAIGMAQLAA